MRPSDLNFEMGIPFSHQEGVLHVQSTVERGAASFALSKTDPRFGKTAGFSLTVGAPSKILTPNGTILSIGLNAAQVRALRDWCDELLKKVE